MIASPDNFISWFRRRELFLSLVLEMGRYKSAERGCLDLIMFCLFYGDDFWLCLVCGFCWRISVVDGVLRSVSMSYVSHDLTMDRDTLWMCTVMLYKTFCSRTTLAMLYVPGFVLRCRDISLITFGSVMGEPYSRKLCCLSCRRRTKHYLFNLVCMYYMTLVLSSAQSLLSSCHPHSPDCPFPARSLL